MTDGIRIYIANLGKYNEGELVGKWVNLPIEEDDLNRAFAEIGLGYFNENGDYVHGLEVNGVFYEEWAIHDSEAPFGIGEYESIERLNEIAKRMEEMSEEEIKVASALLEYGIYNEIEEALDAVEDREVTIWHENSMADIAMAYYEESGQINWEHDLAKYIDWEAVGRDMQINGTFVEVEYGLWVECHR